MAKPSENAIQLIVGLGNPGAQYDDTRHNAGFWFVEELARAYGAVLQPEKKFFGHAARISINGQDVRLLNPTTFMNRSGQAVGALATFYKIPPQSILVAHDELDLPPGVGRLKQGGGHGGHNGLRDIIASLGNNKDFLRLRLGIGHPGNSKEVVNYVLNKPAVADRQRIDAVIDEAVRVTSEVVNGARQKAVQELHTFKG
ncbi:aminoacyl-tRNA hydrolase [Endozoicomonas gorgoniicola]|uniref:Peptidyl-tRNA hydrolase n=1 Tax=Endozoicomonas gorgoniicola TaxID=1234144 RepID=A0ABT3MNZ6_9GAMM|nr:aminoacyl-tRNA hydrolase [Endozoicomonas gorgoniicola]MCW7551085.1 aminoacyl-tRNA hydrolase [Endozoicomonas gorgoniicola]